MRKNICTATDKMAIFFYFKLSCLCPEWLLKLAVRFLLCQISLTKSEHYRLATVHQSLESVQTLVHF